MDYVSGHSSLSGLIRKTIQAGRKQLNDVNIPPDFNETKNERPRSGTNQGSESGRLLKQKLKSWYLRD